MPPGKRRALFNRFKIGRAIPFRGRVCYAPFMASDVPKGVA